MGRALAIDLSASSGRAMLAEYREGRIVMEEIHRFANDPVMVRGTLYWDILRLLHEIKTGIAKAAQAGGFDSMGIDTWGCDFGLLGADGRLLGNPVHYRDRRTDGWEGFHIPKDEVYMRTGIQHMQLNTLYQLDALTRGSPEQLKDAHRLLFIPDLLNYFLTGEQKTEYTIASTSQLLDAHSRDWDWALIEKAGIPRHIFSDIVQPGSVCGLLSDDICEELSAPKAKVISIASHDTASAVAAVPAAEKDFLYISCGTWALLGTETDGPVISEKAMRFNFSNEGGVGGTIRFLKNIMGTWLIQESRRQWIREGREYGFGELEQMARASEPFRSVIDVDHPDYYKPGNLPERIRRHCRDTGQPEPVTPGEVIRCIDEGLALKFRYGFDCVRQSTGRDYRRAHMLGGGARDGLLCQMTADAGGMAVTAGPDEATVLGNIAMQLIAGGELKDVREARQAVRNSCSLKTYEPGDTSAWLPAYEKLCGIAGIA